MAWNIDGAEGFKKLFCSQKAYDLLTWHLYLPSAKHTVGAQ